MKTLAIIFLLIGIAFLFFQIYLAINTSKTESQAYKLIKNEKGFEIRFYPSVKLAQITSTAHSYRELSSPGFRKLAGYIFGGNEDNTKIAMTSPVHMDINDSVSTMSFVLPAEYQNKSLPQPNDASIKISNTLEEYAAVLHFGGFANDASIKANTLKLKKMLDRKGINSIGNFRYLGYNPPYQLISRKNEIIVRIEFQEK
jgi:hypothetical protein